MLLWDYFLFMRMNLIGLAFKTQDTNYLCTQKKINTI